MALDDTNQTAPFGSVYGLNDAPWPPPSWMPAPEQVAQQAPQVTDELPYAGVPDQIAAAEPAPSLGVAPTDVGGPAVGAPPQLPGVPALATALGGPLPPPGLPPQAVPPVDVPAPDAITAPGVDPATIRHQQFLASIGGAEIPAGQDGEDAALAARNANESPEDFIARSALHEEAKRREFTAGLLAANTKKLEDAQAAHDTFLKAQDATAAARAQVEVDAKKIGEVDPKHWMNSSTYNSVTGIIAATLGGLGQMQNGGRNLGLEQLNKLIDNDIESQKFNIQQKRADLTRRSTSINEQYQSALDADREAATYRSAVYESAVNQLTTKAQDFDPRGTTRLQIEGQIRTLRATQAKAMQDFQEKHLKNVLDVEKAYREQQTLDETKRNHLKDEGLRGYEISSANKRAQDQNAIELKKIDAETAKATATKEDKAAAAAAESEQKFSVPGVTTKDGKPFVAVGTDTGVEKLRMTIAATKEVVGITDEIRRVRSGFTSKLGNSDENQRLASLTEQLNIALKNAHDLGAITPTDEKLIEGARGFDDATKWRSIDAGIKQARANIIRKTNLEVQAHKRPGDDVSFDIPDMLGNKAEETPQERELHDVLQAGAGNTSIVTPSDLTEGEKAWREAGGSPANPEPGGKGLGDFIVPAKGRSLVDKLVSDVSSDDPGKRDFAVNALTEISQKGGAPGLRAYAESVLQGALSPQLPPDEASSDFAGYSAGAHESLPVPLTPNPRGTQR